MTRSEMMSHEKPGDWYLFEGEFNTPPTAPVPFKHHTEAEAWVNANATGPVCVVDRWTYGRMKFDMGYDGLIGGWTTNTERSN